MPPMVISPLSGLRWRLSRVEKTRSIPGEPCATSLMPSGMVRLNSPGPELWTKLTRVMVRPEPRGGSGRVRSGGGGSCGIA